MDSKKKRAHGQTEFKAMCRRESRHGELLSTINNLQSHNEEDFELEDEIFNAFLPPISNNMEDS